MASSHHAPRVLPYDHDDRTAAEGAAELVSAALLRGAPVYLATASAELIDELEELAHEVYDEHADGSVLEFYGTRLWQSWRVIVGGAPPADPPRAPPPKPAKSRR